MIGRLFKLLWTLVVLIVIGYLVFFVKLGDRTFFQHAVRIMQTDEAKELRQEVGQATKRASTTIKTQVSKATGDKSADALIAEVRERLTNEVDKVPADAGVDDLGATIAKRLANGQLLPKDAEELRALLEVAKERRAATSKQP